MEMTLAPVGAIPEGEGRTFVVGGERVAVFRMRGGQVFAVQGECPHRGGPLADGLTGGSTVVCPLHAWKVNLASGAVERPAQGRDHCVTTYPTRVEHGVLVVGLPLAAVRDEEAA